MCIALITTAHPLYPYILLSNRDEELDRPTQPAAWWDAPDSHVLGGRDLQRPERGTWLALTRTGRLALLTNFREEGVEVRKDKSRGGMVKAYLTGGGAASMGEGGAGDGNEKPREFARRLIEEVGVQDVGGFSLLFGELRAVREGEERVGLSILSNRSQSADQLEHLCRRANETHGLSNSHFGDCTWPKVVHGEQLLRQAVMASVMRGDAEEVLVEHLFDILSVDTLPRQKEGEDWETFVRQFRNSIFIPPVARGNTMADGKSVRRMVAIDGKTGDDGDEEGVAGYGTQKQTVVLVDQHGHVLFVERTLYDQHGRPTKEEEQEKRYEFEIEGWEG